MKRGGPTDGLKILLPALCAGDAGALCMEQEEAGMAAWKRGECMKIHRYFIMSFFRYKFVRPKFVYRAPSDEVVAIGASLSRQRWATK